MTTVIATVTPSLPRRYLGVGMMGFLGFLLLWMAVSSATHVGWRVALLALGGVAIFGALSLWRATAVYLELTKTELRDSAGTLLVRVDQIVGVQRGAFAMKPSNGFVLNLSASQPRGWAPGLWWRAGRRLGVGGVTSAQEGKAMAEIIAVLLARRREETGTDGKI